MVMSASVVFGVEVESSFYSGAEYVVDGGIVKTTVDWYKVEIRPGIFDWTEYDKRMAALEGHPLILTVRNAPYFYRLWSSHICSPPQEQYYSDYRNFINAVIERYHPYAVEVWNEPDVWRTQPDVWYFGCWLELGGTKYGDFLAATYRSIKSKHPGVTVVGGAFMMNSEGQKVFVKSAIRAAGRYVDVWSYHSYPYYHRTENTGWNAPFDRSIWLRTLTDKPLWLTETSLLCKDEWNICDSPFENAKADYLQFIHKYAVKYNISTIIWFEMKNSWRNCSLINPKPELVLPSYTEYKSILE